MNAQQRLGILEKVGGLAYDLRREPYFTWLDIRKTSSGVVSANAIPDNVLAEGDGVFWSWRPKENRAFIKSPVAALTALEAIDELRPLPFTKENGDC